MAQGPFTRLQRPPRQIGNWETDSFEITKWFDRIWFILSGIPGIAWDIIDKVGSKLSDIETRPHSMLTDIDGTGTYHITSGENLEITAIDGLGAGVVAKTADATYANRTLTGTASEVDVADGDGIAGNPTFTLPTQISGPRQFGATPDYTEFAADGSMTAYGEATVFDDALFEIESVDNHVHASSGDVGGLVNPATTTGTYVDTLQRNGVYWSLAENSGDTDDYFIAIATPLVFDDIYQVPVMFWSGVYIGSAPHAATMAWQVYNNTTTAWDALTYTFVTGSLENAAIVTGFTAQHINASNQVKIILVHTSTGTNGHFMNIDEVYLAQDSTPIKTFYRGSFIDAFRNTGFDAVHGRVQFSHKYKTASDFHFHIHFVPLTNIADGETVIFTLSKSFAAIHMIFPAADTITATFTNDATWRATLTAAQAASILTGTSVLAGAHTICAYASTISGAGLDISAIGLLELHRDVGTYTGQVGVLYADFHLELNTLGSKNEFVK